MKDIPTLSLLGAADEPNLEHAVFLTYGIDLPFFEDSILNHLRRQGARNIAVFADGHHVAAQLRHLAEMKSERKSRSCGRHYSLTAVRHQTAFHPKMALLVGDSVQLWIGSGNLESGGLRSNLEIHNLVQVPTEGGQPPAMALISHAWRYIRDIAKRNPSEVVRKQLEAIEESLPWLQAPVDSPLHSTRLVLGPNDDAFKVLAKEVRGERVERAVILSPFFDSDFRTLKELIKVIGPKRVQILVQAEMTSLDGREAAKLSGVDFYKLRAPNNRFSHAKLILLETGRREVILAGSHNFSERALNGQNFEAGVLQTNLQPEELLESLKISEDIVESNRLSKTDLSEMSVKAFSKSQQPSGPQVLLGAEIEGDLLTVIARSRITSKNVELFIWDDSTAPTTLGRVKFDGDAVKQKIDASAARHWTAVALQIDGMMSAPVSVHFSAELLALILKSRRFRDLARRAAATGTGLEEVEELVEDLRSVLFDEWKPAKTRRASTPAGDESEKDQAIHQLRYEDFIIPLRAPEGAESPEPSGERASFDMALGSILASLGGTKSPLCAEVEAGADVQNPPEDLRALLDSKSDAEEALLASAKQAEGEVDERDAPPAETATPAVPPSKPIVEDPARRLKLAEGYKRKFEKMASELPAQLESRLKGERRISLGELEVLLTGARLFTGLVGRSYHWKTKHATLLDWDVWAEAQAGLLDVLTTQRLRVFARLPWERSGHGALRELHESLAGWCLTVRGYLSSNEIEEETRCRVRVGLRLAGQLLGIDQGTLPKAGVLKAAKWILGHRAPGTPDPILDFEGWAAEVGRLRLEDQRLRKRFMKAGDIYEAAAGIYHPEPGKWAWWPHFDGHIGIITRVESGRIELFYEVFSSKKIQSGYAVEID